MAFVEQTEAAQATWSDSKRITGLKKVYGKGRYGVGVYGQSSVFKGSTEIAEPASTFTETPEP